MMNVDQAKRFAETHFPSGPEKLAEKLGIKVRVGPLVGCDGWVLSGPGGVVIRLSDGTSPTRRRFTLAHELGHLLLGIPTVVGESVYESLRSNSSEERAVNDLASELLIPESVVRQQCPGVPVVAAQLKKLARDANVSQLAAAIRVANLAAKIGLVNASVAFFKDDEVEWSWSTTLAIPPDVVESLLHEARDRHPQPFRYLRKKQNEILVACVVENPLSNSATLFVQLLPSEIANQPSIAEQRIELETDLFSDDAHFRAVMQGRLSAMKKRSQDMTLKQAISDFNTRYVDQWTPSQKKKVTSQKGQEYVRLRLSEWCK